MAPAKAEITVKHKVLPNGDHAIGAVIDGGFVPFAQLDANYVDSLVAASKSPEAKAAAGDQNGGDE